MVRRRRRGERRRRAHDLTNAPPRLEGCPSVGSAAMAQPAGMAAWAVMPTSLTVDQHLEAVAARTAVVADIVGGVDLAADVPTCPGWSLYDLVAHLSGVHRWATAQVRGEREADPGPMFAAPAEAAALVAWLTEGAGRLMEALRSAPDDLEALRFLNDAPAPRPFWARRQAHETTIHSVDAQAAALGRTPAGGETGIHRELAVDGLDELLNGFLPRERSQLRHRSPIRVAVVATDSAAAFTVDISEGPPVTRASADVDADLILTADARALYLGLWNRGEELAATGNPDVLDQWRRDMRVRWS